MNCVFRFILCNINDPHEIYQFILLYLHKVFRNSSQETDTLHNANNIPEIYITHRTNLNAWFVIVFKMFASTKRTKCAGSNPRTTHLKDTTLFTRHTRCNNIQCLELISKPNFQAWLWSQRLNKWDQKTGNNKADLLAVVDIRNIDNQRIRHWNKIKCLK